MAHIPNLETWDFLCFQRHLIQISGKDTFPASPFMCRCRVTWFSIGYSGLELGGRFNFMCDKVTMSQGGDRSKIYDMGSDFILAAQRLD